MGVSHRQVDLRSGRSKLQTEQPWLPTTGGTLKNIRVFGLAAAAALVLIAILGVSSASASNFTAPGAGAGVTTLKGSGPGTPKHELTLGGDHMACTGVLFSGQMTGEASPDITVTPEISGCNWFGYSAKWVTNGCKYRFHSGEAFQLPTSVDITGCTEPMSFTFESCRLEIGNQNRVGTVAYSNSEVEGHGVIKVVATLEGITYKRLGSCISSLPGVFHDGKYTGEWTINGTTSGGFARSVGVESTGAPAPSVFSVEETPATVSGAVSPTSKLMLKFGSLAESLKCNTFSLNGTVSSLTSPTLTLKPSFTSGCKFNSVAIPDSNIETGGCSFVYGLDHVFSGVNGSLIIGGETCASKPMTITRPGCLVTIGPQSEYYLYNPYSNSGMGRTRTLTIHPLNVVGELKYTATGPNCAKEGTFTNGEAPALFLNVPMSATNSVGQQQGISLE